MISRLSSWRAFQPRLESSCKHEALLFAETRVTLPSVTISRPYPSSPPLLRGIPLISWQRGLFHRGKKNRSVRTAGSCFSRRSGVRTVLYFFNGSTRITLSLTIKSVWKQRFRTGEKRVTLWHTFMSYWNYISTEYFSYSQGCHREANSEKKKFYSRMKFKKIYYTRLSRNLFVIKRTWKIYSIPSVQLRSYILYRTYTLSL